MIPKITVQIQGILQICAACIHQCSTAIYLLCPHEGMHSPTSMDPPGIHQGRSIRLLCIVVFPMCCNGSILQTWLRERKRPQRVSQHNIVLSLKVRKHKIVSTYKADAFVLVQGKICRYLKMATAVLQFPRATVCSTMWK